MSSLRVRAISNTLMTFYVTLRTLRTLTGEPVAELPVITASSIVSCSVCTSTDTGTSSGALVVAPVIYPESSFSLFMLRAETCSLVSS